MGIVYRARDTRLDRDVALKVLPEELGGDLRFRDRFLAESRLAASIEHPNIVPVHEAGDANGALFIAMRYVHGSDLGTMLARDGALEARATSISPISGSASASPASTPRLRPASSAPSTTSPRSRSRGAMSTRVPISTRSDASSMRVSSVSLRSFGTPP
jgi:serine/threonine-protein kinase